MDSAVRVITVFLILAVLCMAAFLVIEKVAEHRRLEATGRQMEGMHRKLRQLQTVIGVYLHDQRVKRMPGPTLKDALVEMREYSVKNDGDVVVKRIDELADYVRAGRDLWGQPLIYTLDEAAPTVSIRSVGPNGVDEAGAGDDLTVIVDWMPPRDVLRHEENERSEGGEE